MTQLQSLYLGLAIGGGLVLVFLFWKSAFHVNNGHLGVLMRFDRFARDDKGHVITYPPGLHSKAPWVKPIMVSLAERSVSVHDTLPAIEVQAADGTRLKINARVRFHVDKDRVAAFLAEAKDAEHELIGLFRLTVREQIARFLVKPDELSAYTALRARMTELQTKTLDAMKDAALHEYGIVVIAVDYLQIDPPEELVDALNAVISAESEANALVARTELVSQQRMLAAEQAVAIAHAHAMATESEIRIVGNELAQLATQGVLRDYVDRRKVEVLGGSRRVYLNHNAQTVHGPHGSNGKA